MCDLLREQSNSGEKHKGRILKWDTVTEPTKERNGQLSYVLDPELARAPASKDQ